MVLPASGIISGSQVGVYVFGRANTDEFSLSASLAGTTVNKGYGTIWRGTGADDTDNQQYNQGANNFSLSDWYSYAAGFFITPTPYHTSPDDACADTSEAVEFYITDGAYWGTSQGAFISNNFTVGYQNNSGTTLAANTRYTKIFEMNAAYEIDNNNGIFINEYPCA